MTKTLKQLVRVLWAIEKDLHVIASNTEVSQEFVPDDSEHTSKKVLNHY
ncbi:hypothetical protein [Lactiplantibacillus plantarum]|uniref:Uncharacterized protein n=2 Tax=Lactiplantibacillus plantarum TaxID=1590 RepID=A0AAW3RJ85_LACPN|nr:hypothetical protein [Lactiplantibacillus plantarum]ERO39710.1 hypothetical protein LPLWJ_31890 [Lactiplantibacillus plantarum WJL]KPN44380.1 hypothetical protein WJL_1457 [Lactiplantibacillus plantarum WJL]KZV05535.1 hypothetical protein NAB1_0049 [Lactiplantibacillus plantarum]KZV05633.1 hypothetical protein NAB2_0595 [Lactiplantibacillus plantarum]MBF9191361.1 hypothetical protein [Lactiplantibacillus plantarum]